MASIITFVLEKLKVKDGPISESIDSASIGEFEPFSLLVEDSKLSQEDQPIDRVRLKG